MKPSACLALLVALSACGGAKETTSAVETPRATGYPQPGHIIPLLTLNNSLLAETADLIARSGNEQEKRAAGRRLVALADMVGSDAWRQSQRAVVDRVNPGTGGSATKGQTQSFLDHWQERHLVRVYDAMKALGGDSILDHCRAVMEDDHHRKGEQRMAFAVLAAHGRATTQPSTSAWGMPAGSGRHDLGWAQPGTTTYPGAPAADPSRGAVRAAAPPEVRGGTIENLDQVATALQPYFVTCYERALSEHGRFAAWISLDARVIPNGHVAQVQGRGDDGVPPSMMQCLAGVLKQATFAPPKGGDTIVRLSWSFLPPAGQL